MAVLGDQESNLDQDADVPSYDRKEEVKAFEESKAGVKGLLDAGVTKVPRMFISPPEDLPHVSENRVPDFQIPVIDLSGIGRAERRKDIVDQVRTASETAGFFRVMNHGIPLSVLEGMIEGVRLFHEQDTEEKKKFYSRDLTKKVKFNSNSNFDLLDLRGANWRDNLNISVHGNNLDPSELPDVCRDVVTNYVKHIRTFGEILCELLSEALGLKTDHLKKMECHNMSDLVGNYYPACPEPEVTLGSSKHTDIGFFTVVLQNELSGLQVLYEDQWVDIEPVPGALVVNIGDLLQLISNDKFKSGLHRVLANRDGPRISVASFMAGDFEVGNAYGPIKELISKENPPKYRQIQLRDYVIKFFATGLDNYKSLGYYKI